jgi:hypothetical protein
MQDRSIFRDVNLLAPEHRIDPRPQTAFLRQLKKKLNRLFGDSVFRIIEINTSRLDREAVPAF